MNKGRGVIRKRYLVPAIIVIALGICVQHNTSAHQLNGDHLRTKIGLPVNRL